MKNKANPDININPKISNPIHLKDFPKYFKKNKVFENIKIVFFGTPEFSAYILENLIKSFQKEPLSKFSIQAVVTNPDQKVGRKQTLTPSDVAKMAEMYHIPILKPEKLDQEFISHHLSFLDADLFIVVSYGKILPQNLLDIPTKGAINIHPSLLPKYRGASPIQQAILNGDSETGVTLMLMDKELDHGPIINASILRLSKQDNYQTLSKKLMLLAASLLLETLPNFIAGKIIPREQNHKEATFSKIIKKEDGYFDINNHPALKILDKMIRAYYPWPTTWTKWLPSRHPERSEGSKIIKFLPPRHPEDPPAGGDEGSVLVQMEGKKPVLLKDFLNGYPDFPIKSLGK